MRSSCVIPANFLQRLAEPGSRFHSDYLAFSRGKLTRAELIARLPHVALLGDSVSLNIYISSPLSTLWRSRCCRGGNWFLGGSSFPKLRSVSQRLEELTPFVAMEFAGVGALVDREGERQNLFRRLLGTRNFSGQINGLLHAQRFPDLILIAIGHNNVDWTWRCSPEELAQPESRLKRQARVFRENFEQQLQRLVQVARSQRRCVAMVIYGLVNFGAYFQGRAEAERRRTENPRLYPHLETTYRYLRSFHPTYRENLIRLARMVNEELRAFVNELNRELGDQGNLQIQYSDALANADLSRAELLHAIDGWHASVEGHNVLAEAAFSDLAPSLQFLGLAPEAASRSRALQSAD